MQNAGEIILSKDFPVPLTSGEETVVGVHHSGVELQEGLNTNNSRYYCSNCKKKIHCYVKIDKDTHEAVVHNTCKSPDCECKCKTHYACKSCGYLHPYGQECDRQNNDVETDPNTDSLITDINEQFRSLSKETEVKKPES